MLQLKSIVKNYITGDQTVEALKGVSLSFRKNEFVAILGASGCGKTTLLNIIGGLDKYTSGDIVINGISTKLYDDRDWDTYRNHSVGFVFQSYNLIPHQTILENVELALTLSGIPAKERKKRAEDALKKVGLSEKLNKLPAQLSGGQMQRVAIARAIVNNPDIILADEPTGALDTETSIQVMDILKELSQTHLVVMVTHNPELATEYASRIIRLKDGKVREDTNPFDYTEQEKNAEREQAERNRKEIKKPSMSLLTALSLSLKNLTTKKARTILTAFAGSIGIIGIALILSLSSGFNGYISDVQRDTLSNYPVKIAQNDFSMTGFVTSFLGSTKQGEGEKYPSDGTVHSGKMFNGMLDSLSSSVNSNNLGKFKKYLDEHPDLVNNDKVAAVNYGYDFNLYLYQNAKDPNSKTYEPDYPKTYKQVNHIGEMSDYMSGMDETVMMFFNTYYKQFKAYMESSMTWGELSGNMNLVKTQYDVLAGELTDGGIASDDKGEYYPLTIVVDEYNTIPDYSLYMMGIMSDEEVQYMFAEMAYIMQYRIQGVSDYTEKLAQDLKSKFPDMENGIRREFTLNDMLNREFNVLLANDMYKLKNTYTMSSGKQFNQYELRQDLNSEEFYKEKFIDQKPIRLKVQSVVRLKKSVTEGALSRYIYYTHELTERLIGELNKDGTATGDQLKYIEQTDSTDEGKDLNEQYKFDVLSTGTTVSECFVKYKNLDETIKALGIVDKNEPSSISFYPTTFENKNYVIDIINDYNRGLNESEKIQYTDYIGMMVSSITTIINAISYVLIAFVSISLVVSSIMIGVITYISVLERTKEIGILRSLGASKSDISRVFNAETIIIGFISGAMGILITVLLDIPISLIIKSLAGIPGVASLPVLGGVVLIVISVALTLIAGIIPSRFAAKRDPVIALRSE